MNVVGLFAKFAGGEVVRPPASTSSPTSSAVAGGDDREVSRQASTRVAADPGLTPATAPFVGDASTREGEVTLGTTWPRRRPREYDISGTTSNTSERGQ